ncbi:MULTISPECIES: response regulator [Methylomonas]|uniref:DNA-binding response regulator n=1 Tax=Methylomonas koyamae TaxID=702114 RepID=A0A291IMP2_9GAMM|nr:MULTISPECIES: response regulator [Methylomonas]ANE56479.1 two-component system response regulator [Methylomonas sp. DH-1]ATG91437.1 response regulator [Methylomonas koyamae]OAI26829.1 DNA-binding response regulator [Methylomonas koyamae]WNB77026.1 response regulator [Methylomonas koyamae]BBL57439.1 DNA-binding response regulator [Methylomonas koyamae]
MIKVLLVDDHELVRSGIEALLAAEQDISVVGVCNCGEQALQLVAQDPPDVVLMDINMPGMGGFEACRRLLQTQPNAKIIALSVHNDGPIPQQLLKLGVVGFVSKASPVNEMVAAIKTVMSGKRYLCQDVASNLAFQFLPGADVSPFLQLSQREAEVVRMILNGKSIQEMSEALALSDKTINTYRYRVYRKLQIKNDVELTRLAVKFNYLDAV